MTEDRGTLGGGSNPNPLPGGSTSPPVGPPPMTTAPDEPAPEPKRVLPMAITAAIAAALAAAALIVALFFVKSDSKADPGPTTTSSVPDDEGRVCCAPPPTSSTISPSSIDSVLPTIPTTTTSTTPSTKTTELPLPRGITSPISVDAISATATRPSAELYCTGEMMSYSASNLLDGDPDTGWGASRGDGTNQSVTATFSSPRHLRQISISPGYLRVGPRRDQGCNSVSAFRFNRIITSVRYDFDDGSSRVQTLANDPRMQTIDVDVVSSSVRVTILGTVLPAGADPDTIISDLQFEGDA